MSRPSTWTNAMDRQLLAGVAAGKSRRALGREIGVGESAAIARYNRLQGIVFPSDQKRGHLTALQAKERDAQRKNLRRNLAKSFVGARDRNRWITEASRMAPLRMIAAIVGLSHERIRQIRNGG